MVKLKLCYFLNIFVFYAIFQKKHYHNKRQKFENNNRRKTENMFRTKVGIVLTVTIFQLFYMHGFQLRNRMGTKVEAVWKFQPNLIFIYIVLYYFNVLILKIIFLQKYYYISK